MIRIAHGERDGEVLCDFNSLGYWGLERGKRTRYRGSNMFIEEKQHSDREWENSLGKEA